MTASSSSSGTDRLQQLVEAVRAKSFDGDRRRYHRFRHSSHDGSAVADCIGSNLRCAHEWGWCEGILDRPQSGKLYEPEAVVERTTSICNANDVDTVRLSGMEPIMEDDHLLRIAQDVPPSHTLQIDTNGMLLTEDYASSLADARERLRVRLSFKGSNPDNFAKLSGVEKERFQQQIKAFQACIDNGLTVDPVLAGVYGDEERQELYGRLQEIDGAAAERLFVEDLRLCPANERKLRQAGFDTGRFTA